MGLGLAAGLAGCATAPGEAKLTVNGELSVRPEQEVRLVVARDAREFAVVVPMTTQEIVKGMTARFPETKDPLVLLAVPWFVAGNVMGALQGGLIGLSSGTTDAANADRGAAVSVAAAELALDEAVARAVQARLEELRQAPVDRLPDIKWTRDPEPALRGRPGPSADAGRVVVRVRTLFQGLQVRPVKRDDLVGVAMKANPPLALVLAVQVALVTEDGEQLLGGVSAAYESQQRTFARWAERDAALLRTELALGTRAMLDELVGRLREAPLVVRKQ